MPDEATTNCLLQSIVTFLGGGLVGTILGHFLAIGRDARNRKHASEIAKQSRKTGFQSFLKVWELEVDQNIWTTSPANVRVTISGQFNNKRSQLIDKSTALESDFQGKERASFESNVKTITDMTPGAIDGEEGRKKLLEAIRNLLAFVRKN